MDSNFFSKINIDPDLTFIPDGMTTDIDACCEMYDELIDFLGGTDIQVLGVGENGHIAFNEPHGYCFTAKTHKAELTENTMEVNSRFFDDPAEIPRYAISMGMRGIMSSKCILIMISGAQKADAVYGLLRGEVTPRCPVSILQLHPNVKLIVTDDAFGKIKD
jgi:glucosamine-6-phosphate deaminase